MSLKTLRVPEIFIGEVSVDGVVIRVRARLGGRLSALAELLRTTSTKLQTVFLYSPPPPLRSRFLGAAFDCLFGLRDSILTEMTSTIGIPIKLLNEATVRGLIKFFRQLLYTNVSRLGSCSYSRNHIRSGLPWQTIRRCARPSS